METLFIILALIVGFLLGEFVALFRLRKIMMRVAEMQGIDIEAELEKLEQGEEELAQHPITIVIVPGIFGEFIKTRPFEEILSKDSEAKKLAKSADKEAKPEKGAKKK